MDSQTQKELEALRAEIAALKAVASLRIDSEKAAARELAAKLEKIAGIKAKAVEVAKASGEKVLKYVVGAVPHYRRGVTYLEGDIIAVPLSDDPAHNPSITWSAYEGARKVVTPEAASEARALSELQKLEAEKKTGPLAPGKKSGRPSDAEV